MNSEKSTILFDGVCNLCNGFVNFLIKRDKKNYFQFGSLQSTKGKELLTKHQYTATDLSTVVLIENGQLFTQSTAVLRIAAQLGGAWVLLNVLYIIPAFLRDPLYRLVARYRYRLFGRRDTCMIPNPELKLKFIE